jgi:thiamine-phosphate pyrophosphorylase
MDTRKSAHPKAIHCQGPQQLTDKNQSINRPVYGLYAVIDTTIVSAAELLDRAAAVLAGGARVLQYRDKGADDDRRHQQALGLAKLCQASGAIFIINDDYQLARSVAADGVHLGEDDATLAVAREYLGDQALIGVSCYNRPELAEQAQQQGADYIALGRCFASSTKPGDRYVALAQIRQVRRQIRLPIVAIGGITVDNVRQVCSAGADAAAVIGALFAVADSEAAARALCSQINI